MQYQYLVFVDKRFRSNAIKELRDAFPDYNPSKELPTTDRFFGITLSCGGAVVQNTLRKKAIFTEGLLPILATPSPDKEYSNVTKYLEGTLGKERFRIEALNVGGMTGENAKSIEVKIGRALEKTGLVADLKNPEVFVYIIFTKDMTIIGELDSGTAMQLDAFRSNKFGKGEKISRSEFKLKEAIDYFGIDAKRIKMALDIGAAPGGWTRYLQSIGAKVVAVDTAALQYEKLDMKNVVHIPKGAQDLDVKSLGSVKFDILAIDVNIEPSKAAELAVKFSEVLSDGAPLVLTIKLIDSKIEKHISEVSAILSGKYSSIKIKKLPHNRMELTLSAKKKRLEK